MILGPAARRSGDFRAKIYNLVPRCPPGTTYLYTCVFLCFCVSVGIYEFTMLRCDAVILGLYDMYCSYTVAMGIYNPVAMEIYNPVWLGVCAAAPNRPTLC